MATKKFFGWRRQLPDKRDLKYVPPTARKYMLPASVDLQIPPPGPPFDPALDQGQLGSCGPNSEAHDIAFRILKEGLPKKAASRLFMYYTTRELMGTIGQDSGVDNRSMLKALSKYGYCDESQWPYNIRAYRDKPPQQCYDQASARAGQILYEAVDQDLATMKACIAGGDPFIFGFTVYESIDNDGVDSSGDIPMPSQREGILGGHDILLTGYDDSIRKFKLRNSWGTWGKNGNGTIPYDYAADPDLAGDFWRVTKLSDNPPVPPPPPPPDPPPSPDPLESVLLTLDQALPAGSYHLLPQALDYRYPPRGVTLSQWLQILSLVYTAIGSGPLTIDKITALIAAIAAILAKP